MSFEDKIYYLLALITVIESAEALRVNMTLFSRCQDLELQYTMPIMLGAVKYDRDDDGVCNTLHAEYEVKERSTVAEWELIITTYRCELQNSKICLENPKEFIEPMHCDRFHTDETGPWYFISSALTNGDRCGRVPGHYNIDAAIMKLEYLEQYIAMGKGTYRIRMLFHIPGTNLDMMNIRACTELDFDVID